MNRDDGIAFDAEIWTRGSYPFQLLENSFIDTAFLEIDSGTLDDICDDLLVDVAHLGIRHLDGRGFGGRAD